MPAPRKCPSELRDRAQRLVQEARGQEPGLSLNAAKLRIGPRVGVNPDTMRGWRKQAAIDAGQQPGRRPRTRGGSEPSSGRKGSSSEPTRLLAASSFFARELDPRLPW